MQLKTHTGHLRAPYGFLFGSSRNLGGRATWGARLRTRKVRGRDSALPAPLLAASLELVGRGTVGALPQPPQGTLSLDPARGRRKGTKSPLDPFSRLSWSRFHTPSACSYLVLRLSPCLLPQLSVKNHNYCDSASFNHASSLPESSCPYDHTAAPCKPCCTAHCALSRIDCSSSPLTKFSPPTQYAAFAAPS